MQTYFSGLQGLVALFSWLALSSPLIVAPLWALGIGSFSPSCPIKLDKVLTPITCGLMLVLILFVAPVSFVSYYSLVNDHQVTTPVKISAPFKADSDDSEQQYVLVKTRTGTEKYKVSGESGQPTIDRRPATKQHPAGTYQGYLVKSEPNNDLSVKQRQQARHSIVREEPTVNVIAYVKMS